MKKEERNEIKANAKTFASSYWMMDIFFLGLKRKAHHPREATFVLKDKLQTPVGACIARPQNTDILQIDNQNNNAHVGADALESAQKYKNKLQTNKPNTLKTLVGACIALPQNAITLIALIITIVVMLILAGVTINLTMGENGLFGIAEKSGEETQIAQLKEKADIEYIGLKMQDYSKEVKLSQIIEKLRKQGYKIESTDTGKESKITGITVNKETLMLNVEETGEIEIKINREEQEGAKYYAKLNNGYYEIALIDREIKIGEKRQEIEKVEEGETVEENIEIEVVEDVIQASNEKNKITVTGKKDGTAKIKIKVNGIEYKEVKVMVGWIAIYTEQDLINMKNGLNKHYILMNDITLTKEWEAIGDSTNQFTGELEGNYHKIEGLSINKPDSDYQGLFGYIGTGGKVSNLTLNGNITGKSSVGILTGYNSGIIENIMVSGTVTGNNSFVGGLVGNNKNGTIEKCYSEVTVLSSGNYAGGLVGQSWGANTKISKSCSSGKVKGNSTVGGLVGNDYQGIIEDAYSTGEVIGNDNIGGLVGYNDYTTIINTYTISKISGSGSSVGGFMGSMNGPAVKHCYWTPEKAGIQTSTTGTKIETDTLMKTQETYNGFDFTSEKPVWIMKTYPELNYNFGGK